MRLVELELNNFCQHRHLLWHFDVGLVGLFGPNGSGKSNALNLGAYAGLTNDYKRHPLNKAGCVRQQMEPGEKSFIRLVAVHDDVQFELLRGLANPENHRLTVAGNQPLKAATPIQTHLEEVLKVKRKLIDEYVFIGQGELFAFASVVDAERIKSFARLCGTERAETCWELTGQAAERDRPLANQITDNADEVRRELGTARKRAKKAKKLLTDTQAQLLSAARIKALQGFLDDHKEFDRLNNEVSLKQSEERHAYRVLAEAEETTKAAIRDRERTNENLRQEQSRIIEARKAAEGIREQDRQHGELSRARAQLEALAAKNYPTFEKPCTETAESLVSEQSKLQAERERLDELLDGWSGDTAVCPTCGTAVEHTAIGEKLGNARVRLPVVKARLKKIAELLPPRRKYEKDLQDQERARAVDESRRTELKRTMQQYKGVKPPSSADLSMVAKLDEDEAAWSRQRAKFDKDAPTHQDLLNKRTRKEADHAAIVKELKRLESQVETVEKRLKTSPAHKLTKAQAERKLDKHRAVELAVERHKAKLSEFRTVIQDRKERLERIQNTQQRSQRAQEWCKLNDQARAILHRDNLPAKVHQAKLEEMEEHINDTLRSFDSPFLIRPSEGLAMTAFFRDGTVMPVAGLSGGQKMMLAISYHLTVNALFAEQMGLMIFDEPTDGLDADNRRLAADVFVRLGDLAKQRGYQIIVVTHDDILRRCFDQIITLERP